MKRRRLLPAKSGQRMLIALGQWSLRGYGMMAIEDAQGFIGQKQFLYHSALGTHITRF
jgi:hypothetical protein